MTTANNNHHVDESFIDALANELVLAETKPLNERIEGNKIELRNYLKYDGGKGRKTGDALLLNKVSNLSVIDVDINKSFDDERKEAIRKNLLSKLDDKDVIVKTGGGGLHIYCNTNLFPATSNRMVKCYKCDDYDIDLMTSIDENKRSLIVMANSRVRRNATTPICSYSFIRGSYESKLTRTVNDVLNDLNIKIVIKQPIEIETVMNDNEGSDISDELADALVGGIADFEIHNDSGSMPIDKEITLFTLFQAINALPPRFINEAYDNAYQLCKLTDKAKMNFDNARARFQHLKTSPFVLCKIEKLYQTEYYNECVKPLLTPTVNVATIDLHEQFDFRSMLSKRYNNAVDVIFDLSKVMRKIDCDTIMYIKKYYNIHSNMYEIAFINQANMKEMLKSIKVEIDGFKSAWDVFDYNQQFLTIKGVKFISNDKEVFSTFQGYKYNVLDKVNMNVIDMFMNFVKEVICDSNDEVYKYVIGWLAKMIQQPGVKNETAIILKGLQGIGKNRFTDIISELLSGYSIKNVTEISELTGNFNSVVENKMFIVLNELKNVGDDRMANFNALKSIITDDTIRINEKNQPRRTAQNVANFMFCTNNSYPVKIEVGDRRYVVLSVNGKYKGNFKYFEQLMNSCTTEFYDNLLTYFMKYDLSTFNVRLIPTTEAKEDLIEVSCSPIDEWICKHYDELCIGIQCSDALMSKPSELKDKTFQMQIKDKCDKKRITRDGKREWFYVLKDECKTVYKQTIENNDDVEIDENDLPTHDSA